MKNQMDGAPARMTLDESLSEEVKGSTIMAAFRKEIVRLAEINPDFKRVEAVENLTKEDAIMWGKIQAFKGKMKEFAELRKEFDEYELNTRMRSSSTEDSSRSEFKIALAGVITRLQAKVHEHEMNRN